MQGRVNLQNFNLERLIQGIVTGSYQEIEGKFYVNDFTVRSGWINIQPDSPIDTAGLRVKDWLGKGQDAGIFFDKSGNLNIMGRESELSPLADISKVEELIVASTFSTVVSNMSENTLLLNNLRSGTRVLDLSDAFV